MFSRAFVLTAGLFIVFVWSIVAFRKASRAFFLGSWALALGVWRCGQCSVLWSWMVVGRAWRCRPGVARVRFIIYMHAGSDGAARALRGRGPAERASGSRGATRLTMLCMLSVRFFFFTVANNNVTLGPWPCASC